MIMIRMDGLSCTTWCVILALFETCIEVFEAMTTTTRMMMLLMMMTTMMTMMTTTMTMMMTIMMAVIVMDVVNKFLMEELIAPAIDGW